MADKASQTGSDIRLLARLRERLAGTARAAPGVDLTEPTWGLAVDPDPESATGSDRARRFPKADRQLS
jgi:hypothetical protein